MKISNGPITLINLLKNVFFKCRKSEKQGEGGLKNQLILLLIKTVVFCFLCNQLSYW
jgi:hypothetical protein